MGLLIDYSMTMDAPHAHAFGARGSSAINFTRAFTLELYLKVSIKQLGCLVADKNNSMVAFFQF